MSEQQQQLGGKLRKWGEHFLEPNGEPIRKLVGHPPRGDILTQLEQLNASLRELVGQQIPPHDGDHVRKSVGKVN